MKRCIVILIFKLDCGRITFNQLFDLSKISVPYRIEYFLGLYGSSSELVRRGRSLFLRMELEEKRDCDDSNK